MSNIKSYICLVLFAAITSVLSAQTTKPVELANQTPFTDNLVISNSKVGDVPVTACMVFDEKTNTVTLKMLSERKLFGFWEEIRYKKAFPSRRLRTDRLTYTMTGNTSDRFLRARHFRKALPRPRCKYVFQSWVSAEGMQMVAAPRAIVNDTLEAIFSLPAEGTQASIRLRDILLMDEVRQKGVSRVYSLNYGMDLNTEYRITIQRNPCFGLDKQIAAAQNASDAVTRSYEAFKSIYDKGVVNSEDGEKLFHELQDALQIQFPVNQDSSACPDLQQLHEQYNQYIDSIKALSVTLQLPVDERTLNVKIILSNARTIDNNVTRWLTTKDYYERADLADQCRAIINDTKEMITVNGARTKEEKDAVDVFKKAEQYFDRTCR